MGIKYTVNEDFFETWSPTMAYVLGYYYADGSLEDSPYIRGKYIRVTSIDQSTIIKIKRWLSSGHTIRKEDRATQDRKDKYLLRIGNHALYDSLLRHGVEPNKSKTMRLPSIPQQFFRHFVRGYFDGDGCVNLWRSTGKTKSFIVRKLSTIFTSGSREFLSSLATALKGRLALANKPLYDSRRSFQLRYSTRDSIKIFTLMYDGVLEEAYLKRKFDIFREYFNLRPSTIDARVKRILNSL